jgi:hypothetical protein
MIQQLFAVFTRPVYALIALMVGVTVFSLAVWLPNLKLIGTVITSSTATTIEKVQLLMSLYGGITTNFTVVSALYTILIAVLFGVYSALLVYYIRTMQAKSNDAVSVSTLGVGGVVSGFFGIGCAACGTFILTSLLTFGGASTFLTLLPLGGQEFGFLGVGLLVYAIYSLLKKLNQSPVCSI